MCFFFIPAIKNCALKLITMKRYWLYDDRWYIDVNTASIKTNHLCHTRRWSWLWWCSSPPAIKPKNAANEDKKSHQKHPIKTNKWAYQQSTYVVSSSSTSQRYYLWSYYFVINLSTNVFKNVIIEFEEFCFILLTI